MYLYEIFKKCTWNIYAFIICNVFYIFFYSNLIVNWNDKNEYFARVKS